MIEISDKALRLSMLDSMLQQDLIRKAKAERQLSESIDELIRAKTELDKINARVSQTILLMELE